MDPTSGHRRELYPEIEPFDRGWMAVGSGHEIYWEQSGRPDGIPVVFLHGGPGAGGSPVHRRFFDPTRYRIVVFDQRGSGRSRPAALLQDNTTQHLIADMERLRRQLGIDRWLLFGGSWGSSLALAYGLACPERCLGFVLRGIFLCTADEVDWFLYGARRFFPENWRHFAGAIPRDERDDLLTAFHRRLNDPDPSIHMPAARAWRDWEVSISTLRQSMPSFGGPAADRAALCLARLEAHYFVNKLFLPDGHILDGLHTLAGLPAAVVQGRYDVVCPIGSADQLVHRWPGGPSMVDYTVVTEAGHSALEVGIRSALVAATDRLATLF